MMEILQNRELIVQLPLGSEQVVLRPATQEEVKQVSFVVRNPAADSSPVVANANFQLHAVKY